MRILSVCCELPPFHFGGYEVGAWRASLALQDLFDAEVFFLTSMRGVTTGRHLGEKNCFRLLPSPGHHIIGEDSVAHGDLRLAGRQRRLAAGLMTEVVDSVKPDAVLFWQVFAAYGVEILQHLRQRQIPAYIYCSNIELPWTSVTSPLQFLRKGQWSMASRWFGKYRRTRLRTGPARVRLDWTRVAFCSQWLKEAHIARGYAAEPGRVIYWGIDPPSSSLGHDGRKPEEAPLKLLWAGRMCREKGLHVLIEALASVEKSQVKLDIHGLEQDADYVAGLRRRVTELKLDSVVSFGSFLDADELRRRMALYDAFVLTSVWDEPFSVVLLEAAAAGLALVSTSTGGTAEILSGANALLYAKEDYRELAAGLKKLAGDQQELPRLRAAALETARNFSLDRSARELHAWLNEDLI